MGYLVERLPECAPVVAEHTRTYDELLLHVLMGDLGRFYMARAQGDPQLASRYWETVEGLVSKGDERVENAVAASLIEWFGLGDSSEQEALRAAADQLDRRHGKSRGLTSTPLSAPSRASRTRARGRLRRADLNVSEGWLVAGPGAANEFHFVVAKGGHLQPLDLGVLHEGQHLRSSHEDVVYSRHCQLEPRARA